MAMASSVLHLIILATQGSSNCHALGHKYRCNARLTIVQRMAEPLCSAVNMHIIQLHGYHATDTHIRRDYNDQVDQQAGWQESRKPTSESQDDSGRALHHGSQSSDHTRR